MLAGRCLDIHNCPLQLGTGFQSTIRYLAGPVSVIVSSAVSNITINVELSVGLVTPMPTGPV